MSDATAGSDRQVTRETLEIETLRVKVNKIIAETAKINRESAGIRSAAAAAG